MNNDLTLDDNDLSLEDNDLSLEDNDLSLEDNDLSLEEGNNLTLEDNNLTLEDNNLTLEDNNLTLEDNDLSLEDNNLELSNDNDLTLEDTILELTDEDYNTHSSFNGNVGKLKMTTTSGDIDSDDILLFDEGLVEDDVEQVEEVESKEDAKKKSEDRLIKAQAKYRNQEGSLEESLLKIGNSYDEFATSYEAYFEQLEFTGGRKSKYPELVQYGEVTKFHKLVTEWSGNIIAKFSNSVNSALKEGKEFTVEDMMMVPLKEVNINKAYKLVTEWSGNIIAKFSNSVNSALKEGKEFTVEDMMMVPLKEVNINKAYDTLELYGAERVRDLFSNELEYNDYKDFLNRYKTDLEIIYTSGNKEMINKLALKTKYRNNYFPMLNEINSAMRFLANVEDVTEHLTYVKNINLAKDEFTCGSCGEVCDSETPFFEFCFLPEGGEKGEIGLVLTGINKCDYCDKYNILSGEELKVLNNLYKRGNSRVLSNLGDFIRNRRHNSFGFAKYFTGYDEIASALPSLIEIDEGDYEIEEASIVIEDLSKSIIRYKELLEFFKSVKTTNISSVTNAEEIRKKREEQAIANRESNAELGRYFEDVIEVNQESNIEITDASISNFEVLAKLMCSVVNIDYNERKTNAINSLVAHFQTSKYGRYLRYSDFISLHSLVESKGIIEELKELGGTDFVSLAMDCYSSLGITRKYTNLDKVSREEVIKNITEGFVNVEKELQDYNRLREIYLNNLKFAIDDYTNLDKVSREEVIKNITEGFVNVEKELQDYNRLREIYLNNLKFAIDDLGSIHISSTVIDDNIKEDYLVDATVRKLIDTITNRMIMNSVSEEFFQAWFPSYKSPNKASSKSVRNTHYRNVNEFKGNAISFMALLEKVIGPMDPHKRGLFKRSANIKMSIYPDTETSALLDKFIKLKLNMDLDEYETLITLDEILNHTSIKNRIIKQYLNKLITHKDEIGEIVNKYGRSKISRLKYYFEHLFTHQEIEKGYDNSMDYLRINKILDKLPNETFAEYMGRYEELIEGDYDYTIRSTELLEVLRENYVYLDVCNIIGATITNIGTTRNVQHKVAMNTIINTLLAHYNSSDIIDILGYDKFIVNSLLNSVETKDFYEFKYTYSEFKLILKASCYLYNSLEINSELSDADMNLSLQESILRRYASELESIGKHIKDIGDVHELITS